MTGDGMLHDVVCRNRTGAGRRGLRSRAGPALLTTRSSRRRRDGARRKCRGVPLCRRMRAQYWPAFHPQLEAATPEPVSHGSVVMTGEPGPRL